MTLEVFEAKAEISFACVNDADKAGFVVYLSENFFYRIGKMRENGQDYIFVERKMADLEVIVYKQEIAVDKLEFRVVSDGQSYDFYYKAGGEEILAASAPTRFLSCELAGKCFTGVLNGVFAECEKEGAVLKLERISLKRLL